MANSDTSTSKDLPAPDMVPNSPPKLDISALGNQITPMQIWEAVSSMQKCHLPGEVRSQEITALLKNLGGPKSMESCLRDPEMTRVLDLAAIHPVFKEAPADFFADLVSGGSHLTPVSRLGLLFLGEVLT